VHLPVTKKTLTLGASPRRYGAPVAIVLYYLNPDFGYYREIACTPVPNGGQGWRKGGLLSE